MTTLKGRAVFLREFFLRLEPVLEVVAQNPAVLPVDLMSAAQQILDGSRVLYSEVLQTCSL